MNDIQDFGVAEQLSRRLNIVDTASPAPSLAPEVFAVVQVAPPSAEDEYLRGFLIESTSGFAPPVALQYTHVRLANLPSSGNLVIVDKVHVYSGADCQLGIGDVTTQLGNVNDSTIRDGRITPVASIVRQTQAVVSYESNISPMTSYAKRVALLPSTFPIQLDIAVVLRPGTSFEIATVDVNGSFYFNIFFRERRAQPSELG